MPNKISDAKSLAQPDWCYPPEALASPRIVVYSLRYVGAGPRSTTSTSGSWWMRAYLTTELITRGTLVLAVQLVHQL